MRTSALAALVLTLALFAGACSGDEATTAAGGDDPGDSTDELPVNDEPHDDDLVDEPPVTEPGDTDPDDTAQPLGAGPFPIADLLFTVDQGDGTDAVTYRLACLGDTATFTGDTTLTANDACLALTESEVRSRLLTDDHLGRPCTEQYGGPQIAVITGTLDEQAVDATIDRTNGCGIHDWDSLLAALLPEAR